MIGSGFGNIFKIPELKKRIFFTLALLVVYRIGVQVPTPGIDAVALASFFAKAKEGLARAVQHVFRRRPGAALRFCPGDHAVHQRIDHPSAADRGDSPSGTAVQGRRTGAQEDHPVHPVRHRGLEHHPGVRHQRGAGEHDQPGRCGHRAEPGMGVPPHDGDHPDRRHGLYHVAGRADHGKGDRKRDLPDHFRRYRGPDSQCHRQHLPADFHRRDRGFPRADPAGFHGPGGGFHHFRGDRAAAGYRCSMPNGSSGEGCTAGRAPICR